MRAGARWHAFASHVRVHSSVRCFASLIVAGPTQLETTQKDLEKAHTALENQQSVNSQLKLKQKGMDGDMATLAQELEDVNNRLSSESTVASTMKSQLAELKMEYIAAGDKLEAEQVRACEIVQLQHSVGKLLPHPKCSVHTDM